jgi:hypothetical protein
MKGATMINESKILQDNLTGKNHEGLHANSAQFLTASSIGEDLWGQARDWIIKEPERNFRLFVFFSLYSAYKIILKTAPEGFSLVLYGDLF